MATGESGNAGIGGDAAAMVPGGDPAPEPNSGEITISGGNVKASGTGGGAGIGGGSGTFSTGDPGNAFIVATGGSEDSVHITGGVPNEARGIIFEGPNGYVYGSPTLSEAATVPDRASLTIPDGAKLTVNSTLNMTGGELFVQKGGTLDGTVSITGSGIFTTENLTEDDIKAPADLVYNGSNRSSELQTALRSITVPMLGQTFRLMGWSGPTGPTVTTSDNAHYDITFTYIGEGGGTVSKQITLTALPSPSWRQPPKRGRISSTSGSIRTGTQSAAQQAHPTPQQGWPWGPIPIPAMSPAMSTP